MLLPMQSLFFNKNLLLILSLCSILFLCVYAFSIDFHSDESIYLLGSSFSSRIDTGPLFSLLFAPFYKLAFINIFLTRIPSLLLGFLSLYILYRTILIFDSQSKALLFVFLFSFSLPFVFVHVRPEIFSALVSLSFLIFIARLTKLLPSFFSLFLISCIPLLTHPLAWIFSFSFTLPFLLISFLIFNNFKKILINVFLPILSGYLFGLFLRFIYSLFYPSFSIIPLSKTDTVNSLPLLQKLTDFLNISLLQSSGFLSLRSESNYHLFDLFNFSSSTISHHFLVALLPYLILLMFVYSLVVSNIILALYLFPVLLQFLILFVSGYYNPTYAYLISIFPFLFVLLFSCSINFRSKLFSV